MLMGMTTATSASAPMAIHGLLMCLYRATVSAARI
jgi:hypothetical protein